MRLFHYLKEVRSWCRVGQIVSGALRLQRASVLPVRCSALCCCAPRRTVLAMNFEPAHHLGLSHGLELAVETVMWGSWRAALAVRNAGATFV
jgi:hypothetical protein|tara:strand:+ start:128 stop:403 length:276 start_codon:yes stop_codon:yes gene_type:complete